MEPITKWPGSPLLLAVGRTLDDGLECVGYEGGFIWPATKHLPTQLVGTLEGVIEDGAEQGEGSETGSERPASWRREGSAASDSAEGSAGRRAGASLVGPVGTVEGSGSVVGLGEALRRYPQFGISSASDRGSPVVKIFGVIQPIADLPIAASVTVYLPVDNPAASGAWAWWTAGIWVGPRHTYLNGSICAFEIADETWHPELGISRLLNLYAVWLARQLYLRAYGRWPGFQRIHTPLERVVEQLAGEYCGCGNPLPYERCCARRDHGQVSSRDIVRRRDELLRRGPALPYGRSTVADM